MCWDSLNVIYFLYYSKIKKIRAYSTRFFLLFSPKVKKHYNVTKRRYFYCELILLVWKKTAFFFSLYIAIHIVPHEWLWLNWLITFKFCFCVGQSTIGKFFKIIFVILRYTKNSKVTKGVFFNGTTKTKVIS